jgi:gas vesicle protein
MSQQDNFSGGFFLGAVLGGIAGGVIGAILANRSMEAEAEIAESDRSSLPDPKSTKKRSLRVSSGDNFEVNAESARKSLEDKIAQLNDAIDEVRDQLKRVDTPVEVRSVVDSESFDES